MRDNHRSANFSHWATCGRAGERVSWDWFTSPTRLSAVLKESPIVTTGHREASWETAGPRWGLGKNI